ncbi:MAG: HupE/UreJ family protein [Myxococcales bacterium]|nr:HupE/UreJ family protein [Myxococcales bacterium]MCB9520569.1 HupE/UreJ family protein [Myxococcales bacterium]MCB9531492.1 HupE/UreJ family protein [Myxococcales bacterium]
MNQARAAQLVFACAVAAVVVASLPPPARAHDFRPAYLGVDVGEAHSDGTTPVRITWSLPATANPDARPTLPAACVRSEWTVAPDRGGGGRFELRTDCRGATLPVGIPVIDADLIVHVDYAGEPSRTEVLPTAPRLVTLPLTGSGTASDEDAGVAPGPLGYFRLGVEHILTGWDHLTFVLLVVLTAGFGTASRARSILAAVTGFTAGHSVTLALAALALFSLPGPPVEACIALSIVFLAREALHPTRDLAARHPWVVTTLFGLLHGFGFAGALRDIGLPEDNVAAALFAFNVGVEAGQLAFVAVVALCLAAARAVSLDRGARTIAAYLAGVVGTYWLIERVVGFW